MSKTDKINPEGFVEGVLELCWVRFPEADTGCGFGIRIKRGDLIVGYVLDQHMSGEITWIQTSRTEGDEAMPLRVETLVSIMEAVEVFRKKYKTHKVSFINDTEWEVVEKVDKEARK